jgi:hypothetical protein
MRGIAIVLWRLDRVAVYGRHAAVDIFELIGEVPAEKPPGSDRKGNCRQPMQVTFREISARDRISDWGARILSWLKASG